MNTNTHKHPRVVAILQARMGSTRLPGKVLKEVAGKPLLSYELERLARAKRIDQIVVATTTASVDDPIAALCRREGVAYFRGSEADVLHRYEQAAMASGAEVVVRITGDCPLIDPEVVDRVIEIYCVSQPPYDYVSNSLKRTFPRGLDTEVFSVSALKRAQSEAKLPAEREHVTLYMYTHPELFALGSVEQEEDQSSHRWTVDTQEDFELVAKILSTLYPVNPKFNQKDILRVFTEHPEWKQINAHIVQKS